MSYKQITAKDNAALMSELWDPEIKYNLEKFVLFNFPWGKEFTPLHRFKGPRTWQREELQAISEHIKNNRLRMELGQTPLVYRSATASGRGIGKSALVSWLILWQMTCQVGSTTIVAANSQDQLETKTWGELGNWHTMALNNHWFELGARKLKPAEWYLNILKKELSLDDKYYYANAQLWNEDHVDSFAGAHNPKGMLVIYDEASGIPQPIWTITKGFFTEPSLHRYWACFSNPRRNTGPFFECFNANRDIWRHRNIDARTVEDTDITVYNDIIREFGEDSREAKVEVKGQFPDQGDRQFISRDIVEGAAEREDLDDSWAPLIMGVDPARFGDDVTVIRFRQGRNGRLIAPVKLKGADNMEVANKCAELINKYDPDAICIDAGNGTGVIDRLKELKYRGIHEVWFGSKSLQPEYANRRTELWGLMREWLKGAAIDKDKLLLDDLVAPEYKFMGGSDKQRLETKEELKARGFHSPDDADALACTFHVNPARRDSKKYRSGKESRQCKDVDYPIFGD